MALIRTLTISTTTFERMKEKLYGFRQTEHDKRRSNTVKFYPILVYLGRYTIKLLLTESFCHARNIFPRIDLALS